MFQAASTAPEDLPSDWPGIRVVCWQHFFEWGGSEKRVVDNKLASQACLPSGLSQITVGASLSRSTRSVYRIFPPLCRKRVWTTILDDGHLPPLSLATANGLPVRGHRQEIDGSDYRLFRLDFNESTLDASEKKTTPRPCDLQGDCLAAIVYSAPRRPPTESYTIESLRSF